MIILERPNCSKVLVPLSKLGDSKNVWFTIAGPGPLSFRNTQQGYGGVRPRWKTATGVYYFKAGPHLWATTRVSCIRPKSSLILGENKCWQRARAIVPATKLFGTTGPCPLSKPGRTCSLKFKHPGCFSSPITRPHLGLLKDVANANLGDSSLKWATDRNDDRLCAFQRGVAEQLLGPSVWTWDTRAVR